MKIIQSLGGGNPYVTGTDSVSGSPRLSGRGCYNLLAILVSQEESVIICSIHNTSQY